MFLNSKFRSKILFFKFITDLKCPMSDPCFRSEIFKFLSRYERKNFRSENQLMTEIRHFRSCREKTPWVQEWFS